MRASHALSVVALLLSGSLSSPVAAAPAERAEAKRSLRLAVYDFELSGVDPRVGRIVTDSVVAELRKLQRLSVIGMDEVRAMLDLEAQKQLVGCEDESCLAEIADALGVDALVIGSIARSQDQHVFGLRRIDQRRAEVVGSVTHRLEADTGESLLAAVGPSVEELFPDHPLRPNKERGVSRELTLRLNPPPLPVWSFWVGAGAAATAAAAGGVLGALSVVIAQDYQALVERSTEVVVDGAELKEKERLGSGVAIGAWSAVGTAAALGAATAVLALFVDWQGYGDDVE